MSPVFMRLHSKRFLMRASARLHFLRKMDFIDRLHTALSSGVTFYIYDWCVSRVLSWTVIYLERMLPYVSSRQSGRSGKP